jgi:hypothetical protein
VELPINSQPENVSLSERVCLMRALKRWLKQANIKN